MGCASSREKGNNKSSKLWLGNIDGPAQTKHSFKVVFLGKSGVGKTSIAIRFCRDTFLEGFEATIGASFLTKTIVVDKRTIKYELWDTAGQERYRSLAPMYYRNGDAAVLVFDYTDLDSFNNLQSWMYEIQKNVPDCIIVICGNKIDLEAKQKVSDQRAMQLAKEHDCLFMRVSSKTGENVEQLFYRIGELLTQKYDL